MTKDVWKFDGEFTAQAGNIGVAYANGIDFNKCFVRSERVEEDLLKFQGAADCRRNESSCSLRHALPNLEVG